MVDPIRATRLAHRLLFVGIVAVLIFIRILPLSSMPSSIPGPDLALGLTLAWVLRHPDYVPAVTIAGVFLLEDLLFMRPPGLWALIVLAGTEFVRAREVVTRDLPFLFQVGAEVRVCPTPSQFNRTTVERSPQANLAPAHSGPRPLSDDQLLHLVRALCPGGLPKSR